MISAVALCCVSKAYESSLERVSFLQRIVWAYGKEEKAVAGTQPFGVPAAPNESMLQGKLVRIDSGPDGMGSIWSVEVIASHDVDQLPNFTQAHIGETISIYIHPEMKTSLAPGDNIQARVSYHGDERGGAFFLIDDDVSKL